MKQKPGTVSVASLRANLRRTLKRVQNGETVSVVRYGDVIARIVPPAPPTK